MKQRFALPANDLLRDAAYRRLWTSILISSLGGQVTMLALPLTAVVLLHASPTQMGLLVAMEIAPFVLLSLPSGVWLDRVRKLPVYIAGELLLSLVVLTVPAAYYLGWLAMPWMYVVAFIMGCVYSVAGSAAQIVLTQVVSRDRLVEAHARNALASSGAEVAGPGFAGALIKSVGAPVALLLDALMLIVSVLILRGVRVQEVITPKKDQHFWRDLKAGIRFVRGTPLLVTMACTVGVWQMCHHAAVVVQILFATRTLGLNESQIGLSFVGLGAGTVLASTMGHRISSRIGPGPCLLLGLGICGLGWLLLAAAPANALGRLDVRADAVPVRRRRGADLHQLPVAAAVGDPGAAARPHDEHDALADPAARRAGRAHRRLARRACEPARVAAVCRCERAGRHSGGVALDDAARRARVAEAGERGRRFGRGGCRVGAADSQRPSRPACAEKRSTASVISPSSPMPSRARALDSSLTV